MNARAKKLAERIAPFGYAMVWSSGKMTVYHTPKGQYPVPIHTVYGARLDDHRLDTIERLCRAHYLREKTNRA